MALRLMLVSLVASLGFELPSPRDLESWGRSGRVWVAARVSELSTLSTWSEGDEAADQSPAPEDVAGVTPEAGRTDDPRANAVDDLAFEVVVEGMASQFAEENAAARIETARVEAALAASEEFARSTSGEASEEDEPLSPVEGLPEVADAAPAEGPATEVTDEVPMPNREVAPTPRGISRSDRLSNAVRLTRSAVEAWVSLIDPAKADQGDEQVVLSR